MQVIKNNNFYTPPFKKDLTKDVEFNKNSEGIENWGFYLQENCGAGWVNSNDPLVFHNSKDKIYLNQTILLPNKEYRLKISKK